MSTRGHSDQTTGSLAQPGSLEPRAGLLGYWDRFVGPGATAGEFWLMVAPAVLAALALPVYVDWAGLGWSTAKTIIMSLLALDLVGGVVTNGSNCAKRWYHRPGQGFAQHFGFVALHGFHVLVIAWLFYRMDLGYIGLVYGYLLLGSLIILKVPLYLQRPTALLVYVGGLGLATIVVAPVPGMQWFLPVFYLKLFVSHLVAESPVTERSQVAA